MNTRAPGPRVEIWSILARRMAGIFLRRHHYQPNSLSSHRRRSVGIRVVDCGSNNAVEQEILAMFNPYYDVERFGFHLVTSPRHADVLLVTGPLTRNMEGALLATFEAMPRPRRVVTVGDDTSSEGVYLGSYAVQPLPESILAARVAHVPGDPPTPGQILEVLLEVDYR